ncbi:MAG TPA: hypothetical protein VNN80_26395 [Polyangiaceae bacterium]|jgi:hypothetical protein|nr:hypothetical protein [Polyangiaceae bacterium]
MSEAIRLLQRQRLREIEARSPPLRRETKDDLHSRLITSATSARHLPLERAQYPPDQDHPLPHRGAVNGMLPKARSSENPHVERGLEYERDYPEQAGEKAPPACPAAARPPQPLPSRSVGTRRFIKMVQQLRPNLTHQIGQLALLG